MRRVVVTGMGAVSPLGGNIATSWDNLLNSRSGIGIIPEHICKVEDLATKIAGVVPCGNQPGEFNLADYLSANEARRMDRFIHFGYGAALQAAEDAGLAELSEEQKLRSGVLIGSGIGGLGNIAQTTLKLEAEGPRRISPFFIPSCLINLISGHVSIKYGLKGPNHSVVTACSTGSHAIGDAFRMIRYNEADVMVAGGAEAAINRVGIAGFNACRALSTNFNDQPQRASRPWDKARDGFVMGEGAGVIVLEELEHAIARGATIYAEVVGYGMSGDAHHITAPSEDGDGAYRSMLAAVQCAGISPQSIDYINAHGTSTPPGDMVEYRAVMRLLEGCDQKQVAMSSTKSAIGHLLGAAGAVEAIFSVLSIVNKVVPPTLNLDDPEDGITINLVPHKAQERQVKIALSNSFGFGGTNATLIFKEFE